jgi:hypothetical protein
MPSVNREGVNEAHPGQRHRTFRLAAAALARVFITGLPNVKR